MSMTNYNYTDDSLLYVLYLFVYDAGCATLIMVTDFSTGLLGFMTVSEVETGSVETGPNWSQSHGTRE